MTTNQPSDRLLFDEVQSFQESWSQKRNVLSCPPSSPLTSTFIIGALAARTEDEFISAATFLFPDEAEVARGLLRSGDILCYLENEHMLAKVWQFNVALGGLRLMVPASLLEQVHEILTKVISEEDLTAQAGMKAELEAREQSSFRIFVRGRRGGRARATLALAVLCAPALDTLRLMNVGP